MSFAKEKAALRKRAFAARNAAHAEGKDAEATRFLLHALADLPAATAIAGYMPIRTEVSPLVAMASLHKDGHHISVPVIEGEAMPLRFDRWRPEDEMVDGPFGAKIPSVSEEVFPTVIITPLVAFDPVGARLGYGGGFYDRSFEKLRKRHPITIIGYAYSAQFLDDIPAEPTDIPLDMIVTEEGITRF